MNMTTGICVLLAAGIAAGAQAADCKFAIRHIGPFVKPDG